MKRFAVASFVALSAITVYSLTAYPTITWWDSASYSLAAATLGVSSSPGSLLLMLLGCPIAHLPLGASPAYRLNLFAGVLAATTSVIVYCAALNAVRINDQDGTRGNSNGDAALKLGAGAGALTFAFGSTTWEYAVMFTPYILTAVFTAALLYVLFRWWQCAVDDSWKWLALLGLLFGLDFSVHRTNLLLIPAALVFVLIRSPRAMINGRNLVGSAVGLLAGLSVQLLIIPIARNTSSELNFGNPRDFTRFLNYESLSQSGGSFFVKIFPRNADVWHVQVADFLRTLGDNALHWSGNSRAAGVLPAIAAVIGLIAIARRSMRFAIALFSLLIVQATMTVIFFNIPADYFRSLDRHYLPVWVTIGVLISCGLATMTQWAFAQRHKSRTLGWVFAVVLLIVPGAQVLDNWRSHDASNRYFARDYAVNALAALPPNAIYFTVGDNDTFPLMYMQGAEHVRPDVQIVNMSVMQYDDYPDQIHERAPAFPISILSAERHALITKPWTDTSLVLPFPKNNTLFGLSPEAVALDTGTFIVKPQWGGTNMSLGDITLLDIVRTNQWRRPITFSITTSRAGMMWLNPYGRLEGAYWRIVPVKNPTANADALRQHLLQEYSYRGYADLSVTVDDFAARVGVLYYEAAGELVALDRARGDTASCRAVVEKMRAALPPGRLVQRAGLDGAAVLRCE
ncbi:MAG: DUF2723 domain-containing protein [Gemmatimonas sp.]